ncbi:MAG: hypothetical protein V1816_08190 [Pseudomonadota bacterium]
MKSNLEIVTANLKKGLSKQNGPLRPPYLYLDRAAVRRIFRELTGMNGLGGMAIAEGGPAITPSLELLFEAMAPILEEKTRGIAAGDDLAGLAFEYLRIGGVLETTRFPDGNLNLELVFGQVRGLLFCARENFDSLARPVLFQDRLHVFSRRVEALVFPVGEIRTTIFYHQAYGDNQEHPWLPLVPVVIRDAGGDPEDRSLARRG